MSSPERPAAWRRWLKLHHERYEPSPNMIEESWNLRLGPFRVELIRTGSVWKGNVDWDYGFTFSLDTDSGRGYGLALTGGTGHRDLEEWEQ